MSSNGSNSFMRCFASFSRFAFFFHNIASKATVSTATPNEAPSPAAAPIGTVVFVDSQLLDTAEVVLVKGQVVGEVVAVIVLLYVIVAVAVAVGNMAVPAARRTVPLPDVQQFLAASSCPQQK